MLQAIKALFLTGKVLVSGANQIHAQNAHLPAIGKFPASKAKQIHAQSAHLPEILHAMINQIHVHLSPEVLKEQEHPDVKQLIEMMHPEIHAHSQAEV